MAALGVQVVSRLAAIWRRRWLVLGAAWAVCAIGWPAVFMLPDRYEAQARLYIDTDTLLGPLLRNLAVENDVQQQVQIMQRTLLSRPNLQKVAVATDLAIKTRSDADETSLYDHLEKNTKIVAQGDKLFSISYTDSNPVLARDVVQALLTILMESNTGQNRTDMEKARSFIEKQIAEYEQILRTTEDKMADFKSKHVGELAAAGNFQGHLDEARQKVELARTAFTDAQIKRDTLKAQLATVPQFLDIESAPQVIVNSGGAPVDPLQGRIDEARHALDNLKSRFTDKHPDVITAQKELDDLLAEQKKAREEAEAKDKSGNVSARQPGRGKISNPVFEQTQMRLLDAEQVLAASKRHLDEATAEEKNIAAQAESAPAIEAQYEDLTREYGVQKKQYEELVQRRESARISQALADTTENIQFRVVEPPRIPTRPSGPKRLLFLAGVLVASIGIAVGLGVLLYQIEEPVTSREELETRFGYPMIGDISLVKSPGHQTRSRRQAMIFATAAASLLVVFLGLMAFSFTVAQRNAESLSMWPDSERFTSYAG